MSREQTALGAVREWLLEPFGPACVASGLSLGRFEAMSPATAVTASTIENSPVIALVLLLTSRRCSI